MTHKECNHSLVRWELIPGERRNAEGMVIPEPLRDTYISVPESCIGVFKHEVKQHISKSGRVWA